jgi:DNA replication factor GINS
MVSIMNYKYLYEAWKREKEGDELQRLDKRFYVDLSQYVKSQKEELQILDDKTLRGRLIAEASKNVRTMFTSLVECRFQKISKMATDGHLLPIEFLTAEEESLYSNILITKDELEKMLNDVLRGYIPQVKDVKMAGKPKRILVRFLQAIPTIVGSDMRTYGPFKVDDVASLPVENVEVMIKRGIAVEVEM